MKANINHYRTFVKDGVINEVPIADEESRVLMEMNYMQYVNLLADIVTKTSNINTRKMIFVQYFIGLMGNTLRKYIMMPDFDMWKLFLTMVL